MFAIYVSKNSLIKCHFAIYCWSISLIAKYILQLSKAWEEKIQNALRNRYSTKQIS